MSGMSHGERPMVTARVNVLLFVIIAVIGVPALGFGQWLHYPTADVPRKADGSPDLSARRSQGVHASVDRPVDPTHRARYGAHRRVLPRERKVMAADGSRPAEEV